MPAEPVVDVGLHVRGWTLAQAADYVAEGHVVPKGQERLVVLRCAVLPGQLTSYDTGALETLALRREAEQALGSKFDLRAFHDRVLAFGAITLPMLRESVERWIAEQ